MSVLDDLSDLDRRVSESDSALDAFARSLVTSSLTGTSQGDQPALDPKHDTPAPPTPAPIHITTTASLSRLPAPELSGPRQLGTPATTAAECGGLRQESRLHEPAAGSHECEPYPPEGQTGRQNGPRAAAQLRPPKLKKRPESKLRKSRRSSWHAWRTHADRDPPGSSQAAAAAAAAPQSPNLMAAAASPGPHFTATAVLQGRHLQELQPQPGWELVVPVQGGILSVYEAIAEGNFDPIFHARAAGGPLAPRLSQLAALPFSDKMRMMGNVCGRVTNADEWSHDAGATGLELTGHFVTLGAIFFNSTRDPDILRIQHASWSPGGAPRAFPRRPSTPDCLGLCRRQVALAKAVFRQRNIEMARIASARAGLVEDLMRLTTNHAMAELHSMHTVNLMDAIARITENAAQQQEVWLAAMRQFIFQVCSPLNLQRIIVNYYPNVPDLPGSLQAVANSA
ncbi:hypothetical protein WJX84_009654 [Apatococcus fuscideae]|uniref:Uncharacterized protein n=1 Tax=Apatococcus fuscideae TaxID=2026836 RepID=A0AAW1T9B3_9CHLO